jgi:hypothetical protein
VGRNLYDIAFDSASPNRIAVAGWGVGVAVSEDRGSDQKRGGRWIPGNGKMKRRHSGWAARRFENNHAVPFMNPQTKVREQALRVVA